MAQMQTVDIVIVGGGPSGAATALSLARVGLSVSVLERTRYEEVRIGETVAPTIRNPLGALGLWERFLEAEHNPSHANRSAWGSPEIHYQDFIFDPNTLAAVPIDLSPEGDQVFLLLFGTGIRGFTSKVTATVGGVEVPVLGAIPQGQFEGLDQVNIGPIPRSLIGAGVVEIILIVDGIPTKAVMVRFS